MGKELEMIKIVREDYEGFYYRSESKYKIYRDGVVEKNKDG